MVPHSRLKPLCGLPLQKLYLSSSKVEDIEMNKGLKLEELTLNSNTFTSLSLPKKASKLDFLGRLKFRERVKHPHFSPGGGRFAACRRSN